MLHTIALGMPMGAEWLVIAALGLLIFGKRLPEIGKGLGRSIVEFKRGIKGVGEDVEQVDEPAKLPADRPKLTDPTPSGAAAKADYKFDPFTGKPVEQPRPKFDPYTGKPVEESASAGS